MRMFRGLILAILVVVTPLVVAAPALAQNNPPPPQNQADTDQGVGIGALAIGNVKYQVEAGLFRRMAEAEKPLYLDFGHAFQLAREIVG